MPKSEGMKPVATKVAAKPRKGSREKVGGAAGGFVLTGSHASAKLLVADQFRTEQGGKILAIGLYADGVVVIPSDAPPPTPEMPLGIELSLLVTISGVAGKGPVLVQLGNKPAREMNVELRPFGAANLVLNLQPLLVESFGRKVLTVTFAGETHELSFEVRQGEPDENSAA